jgi:hypothetical protein
MGSLTGIYAGFSSNLRHQIGQHIPCKNSESLDNQRCAFRAHRAQYVLTLRTRTAMIEAVKPTVAGQGVSISDLDPEQWVRLRRRGGSLLLGINIASRKWRVSPLSDRGVASAAVVTVLDPCCDAHDPAGPDGSDATMLELRCHSCEASFGQGVISENSSVFHRPDDAVLGSKSSDLHGRVFRDERLLATSPIGLA